MPSVLTLQRFALGIFLLAVATACAPGTNGLLIADAGAEDVDPLAALGDEPIDIALLRVPTITLPALPGVGEYDELLKERLGDLEIQSIDGVEIVEAECADGDVLLEGDDASSVFDEGPLTSGSFRFTIDATTGGATYYRDADGIRTSVETNGDGSGVFIEESRTQYLSIEAERDGAGRYYLASGDTVTSIDADAMGAGTYVREAPDAVDTITLGTDGSGELFSESPDRLLTVDAQPDGSGDLYLELGDRLVTLRVRADGSWEFNDGAKRSDVTLLVHADGSGSYRQRGEAGTISLDFDDAGTTHWRGQQGPPINIPPTPRFVVADRFPPLGTLATIAPPCVRTTLRFDSQVLFADNDSQVLPAAAAVLADVVPALREIDRPIEVAGHTDARGDEAYNQELSEDRAAAVAEALRQLGLEIDMQVTGYGEAQPVAPNFTSDGADDPAGQAMNRRVEIVIRDGAAE